MEEAEEGDEIVVGVGVEEVEGGIGGAHTAAGVGGEMQLPSGPCAMQRHIVLGFDSAGSSSYSVK